MGQKDIMEKEYMSRPEYFADAFNYLIYQGEQIIREDALSVLDTTEIALFPKKKRRRRHKRETVWQGIEKLRDVLKKCVVMEDERNTYLLLGIENQTNVHYAMPVRNMLYDAISYYKQVVERGNFNRRKKLVKSSEDFLSGMLPTDRLKPVITLVIYFGSSGWDGPRSLKEMFQDMDEHLLGFVNDYKLNLIVPDEIEDFTAFSTDFGKVLHYIKISGKENGSDLICNEDSFRQMDNDSVRLINVLTNSELEINEKEGVTDVCVAWDTCKKNAIQEGIKEGMEQNCLANIHALMISMEWTAERAMEALQIPENERADYLAKL